MLHRLLDLGHYVVVAVILNLAVKFYFMGCHTHTHTHRQGYVQGW